MNKVKMGIVVLLALVVFSALATGASAAAPVLGGKMTIGTRSGNFTYTPVKGISYGSEGDFVIWGKHYIGSIFTPRSAPNMISMGWYDPNTFISVGNAAVTLQPDGSYQGTVTLYRPDGTVRATGTLVVSWK